MNQRWTIDDVEYLLPAAHKQRLARFLATIARPPITRARKRGRISARLPVAAVVPPALSAEATIAPVVETVDASAAIVSTPDAIVDPKPIRQCMSAASRLAVIQRLQSTGVVLYDEGA